MRGHPKTKASRSRDPVQAIRDAFHQRASHAIDHIVRSASPEALADALAAPTDFGAVARALRDSSSFPTAVALDPLADALARGAAEREDLVAKGGGLLSAEAVGKALGGISRQAVDKRRRARQILAVRIANDWRYPASQFTATGEVVPGLGDVLNTLASLSPWAVLDFLLADDTALGGVSPFAALHAGGDRAVEASRVARAHQADVFG